MTRICVSSPCVRNMRVLSFVSDLISHLLSLISHLSSSLSLSLIFVEGSDGPVAYLVDCLEEAGRLGPMMISCWTRAGGGGGVAADQAEVAALLAEENVEVLTQEEADRLTQLDALTVCVEY